MKLFISKSAIICCHLVRDLDNTKLGKVFPISFHFSVFFVAQVVTTYWTSMMAVHCLLMYAYNKLASLDPSTALSSTTDHQASARSVFLSRSGGHKEKWETMTKNVCQSTEYFLQDKMGSVGPLAMLTQLRGCQSRMESIAEDWSREVSWITEVTEKIRKKSTFL
jgi:hypothetical protein